MSKLSLSVEKEAARLAAPSKAVRRSYQLFPNLTADEVEALTADIRERGVMVPVEVDEAGNILDGHHRAMVADSLGIDYPTVVREGWTEPQKLTHVVALNAHRRHLAPMERREVIHKLRLQGMSTRAIAKAVKTSDATVRRDLTGATSDAPVTDVTPDSVTGLDGKSYPATRTLADDIEAISRHPDVVAASERARWSAVIAGSARVLTQATPDYWADRLDPGQAAALRSHLSVLSTWIEAWQQALSRPALHSVGGPR